MMRLNEFEYERPLDCYHSVRNPERDRQFREMTIRQRLPGDPMWREKFENVLDDIRCMGSIEMGHQKRPLHHGEAPL